MFYRNRTYNCSIFKLKDFLFTTELAGVKNSVKNFRYAKIFPLFSTPSTTEKSICIDADRFFYTHFKQPYNNQRSIKKWLNEQIEMLIILRNSTDWDKRFSDVKGKAKQTGDVWTELFREISAELTGVEARVEYNYLLNQFKKHKLIADKSGEGSARWKHYLTFKDCLLRTPAVTSICTADSARFENPVIFDALSDFENSDSSLRSDSSASKAKHKKKESYETKMLSIMEARNNVIASILTNKSDSGKKTDEKIKAIQTDIKSLNDKIDLLFQKLMKDDKK